MIGAFDAGVQARLAERRERMAQAVLESGELA
jgi:hypothetical protein